MSIFYQVPAAQGVPPVLRDPALPQTSPPLLTSDGSSSFGQSVDPQWGIFLNNSPVIASDNVIDMSYRKEWTLSDYPVEKGAFQTYDKVETPFEVNIALSVGGTPDDRATFIQSADTILTSLDLYDVVTPEAVYSSVNFRRNEYDRNATKGAGLITIGFYGEQIRVTATAEFSNTKSPVSASPVNGGTVQTTSPSMSQAAIPAEHNGTGSSGAGGGGGGGGGW